MLTSAERQAHLNEMGVPQWYSRFNLLGAAQSPESVFISPDVVSPSADAVYHNKDKRRPRVLDCQTDAGAPKRVLGQNPQSALEVLEAKAPSQAEPENLVLSKSLEQRSSVASEALTPVGLSEVGDGKSPLSALDSFSLHLYRTGGCMVVTESSGVNTHASELMLLQNILRVSEFLSPDEVSNCHYKQGFHWPVFQSLKLKERQNSLVQDLVTRWFSSFVAGECHTFLYFSSNDLSLFDIFLTQLKSAAGEKTTALSFPFSLAELLQLPARKSDIWRVLSKSRLKS